MQITRTKIGTHGSIENMAGQVSKGQATEKLGCFLKKKIGIHCSI